MDDMFYNPTTDEMKDWSGFTLLLPVIGVGNVGQLTVDLLVSTLMEKKECQLVGRVFSNALMPVSGPDPYNLFSTEVMTTCQVYEATEKKLVILQQRAPCYRDKRKQYLNQLIDWIKSMRFEKLIVLSSAYSQYLVSALGSGERCPIRFLHTSAADLSFINHISQKLSCKHIEKVDKETLTPNENGVALLAGSGMTKALYEKCESERINAVFFVAYCSEGDNTVEAFVFAKYLNGFLQIADATRADPSYGWRPPISWKNFYGDVPPYEMF